MCKGWLFPRSCTPRSLVRVKGLPAVVICLFMATFAFARDWLGKLAIAMMAAWCIFLCRDACADPDRCTRQLACDIGIDLDEMVELALDVKVILTPPYIFR